MPLAVDERRLPVLERRELAVQHVALGVFSTDDFQVV